MKRVLLLSLSVLIACSFILPADSSYAYYADLSGLKICVDAGHGGSDSGAEGIISYPGGATDTIWEKDLTLMFANYLENELQFAGATVVMTRTSDVFVGINSRWQECTNENVDALISIHFDAMHVPPGQLSFYAQTRPQDQAFAQTIHDASHVGSRGVLDDTHSFVGSLGVLRYGGDFPRVLIEVDNMDWEFLYGIDLMNRGVQFSRDVVIGLDEWFN